MTSALRSPKDISDLVNTIGVAKTKLKASKLLLSSFMGGIFAAMGAYLATMVAGGSIKLQEENPSLAKFLLGAAFPLGMMGATFTGCDLFLSNCMIYALCTIRRSVRLRDSVFVVTQSYLGNFAGTLFCSYVFGYATGLFPIDSWPTPYLFKLCRAKLALPFHQSFVRGVAANLLICLAAWQGYSANDTLGRIVGQWWPVMAFVAMGFENSVANMFYIPTALFAGLDSTWGDFFVKSLIPSTLGNIVGGGLFIGVPFAWIHMDTTGIPAPPVATKQEPQNEATKPLKEAHVTDSSSHIPRDVAEKLVHAAGFDLQESSGDSEAVVELEMHELSAGQPWVEAYKKLIPTQRRRPPSFDDDCA